MLREYILDLFFSITYFYIFFIFQNPQSLKKYVARIWSPRECGFKGHQNSFTKVGVASADSFYEYKLGPVSLTTILSVKYYSFYK